MLININGNIEHVLTTDDGADIFDFVDLVEKYMGQESKSLLETEINRLYDTIEDLEEEIGYLSDGIDSLNERIEDIDGD